MSDNLPAERSDFTTPALADQWESDALSAIENVETPEDAEAILLRVKIADQAVRIAKLGEERERRWHKVKLLAERKYGELLGPAERGGPNIEAGVVTRSHDGAVSDDERKQRERARAVAAVPEETFEEYVETAENPSRAGLLSAAREPLKPAAEHRVVRTATHTAVMDTIDQLLALRDLWEPSALGRVSQKDCKEHLGKVEEVRAFLSLLEDALRPRLDVLPSAPKGVRA